MSGKKVYIALTAGQGCLWGASISENASKEGLKGAYGEFKQEAREIAPSYQPSTVTTDGWEATRRAWEELFEGITLILCFLHEVLKIREVCRSQREQCKSLCQKLWEVYQGKTKREWAQRLRRFLEWVKEQKLPAAIIAKVRRLHLKSHLFQTALDFPSAYRTSNQVDRPMNYFDRVLYSMQYFHGNLKSARLTVRSLALLWNFRPYCRKTRVQKQGQISPFESLNGFRYHENWLRNLLIASSLNGRRPLLSHGHKFLRN